MNDKEIIEVKLLCFSKAMELMQMDIKNGEVNKPLNYYYRCVCKLVLPDFIYNQIDFSIKETPVNESGG